ncbi:uncharacterized protein PHACADRAFT_250508 [Phanerochaete carnosa HHB-10118-sp]|uniref:Uncharacterized protein n=1 Tax=Phanerochaete carnosa (strain HHB-10118-sp) TaxID=650164 RepID=K5W756_PHACS|nr:uncharacterized protein PHACADRAFT_250508 [Phanerochaete carnosa HHB-10118-sp]EKM59778.1 hypothetical protein PHACADRAFT_250508 [Phanerochaete carnosa HHB-10118-sp]
MRISLHTELGLTSALCKNLYEANLSLKSKHDALLARIPTQLGQTVSPLPSPTRALSPLPPLPATPHYYSISRPSSPSATLSPSLGPSSPSPSVLSERSRKGHARRISVTPSDLSYLADQNAELMHKLEKLEEESAQADARGKRKLKKLEKEIGLLKEELEKTRERGAELEERVMKKVTGVDDKEEEQKRRRREERVRALRRKGADEDEDEDEKPVVDFAPAPELPKIRTTLPVTIPEESEAALADEASIPDIAIISSSGDISSLTASTSASTSASPLTATSSQAHHLDYAIIAQLLSKIHELEETNIQIATEQRATSERLQTAQREVDGIKRAYDCLGHDDDEIEVCVVPDDEGEGSSFDWPRDGEAASAFGSPLRSAHASTGHTIRFSSLRRTIDGDASRLTVDDPKDDFASGVMRQSTTRSMLLLDNGEGGVRTKGKETKQKGGIQKTRKTVVGLFDNPAEGSSEARECTDDYFASLHASPSFRTLSPMPISPVSATPDMGDISGWSNAATDNELSCSFDSSSSQSGESDYASPIPSTAGFLTSESRSPSPSPSQLLSQFPSPAPSPSMLNVGGLALHTLGSELGSEFGDDWGERAGNHHLRATSLCEMNGDVSMESTGSVPGGWVLDGTEDDALYGSGRSRSLTIDVEHEDDHARTSSGASTAIARSVSGASASGSTSPSGTAAGTPTRANFPFHDGLHPQVVVQPPTPSANKYRIPAKSLRSRNITPIPSSKSMPGDGSGYGVSTLEKERLEKMNSRNARLSQTVRARTNRWVERRYAEYAVPSLSPVTSPTLPSVPFPSAQDTFSGGSLRRRTMQFPLKTGHAMVVSRRRRTASTAKEKMDESFEDAVHRVSRSISFSASGSQSGVDFAKLQEMELNFACSDAEPEGDSPRGQQNFVMQAARRDAAGADRLFAKKGGFVGFVLEVWLWLQFAIVVVVFLWAMARKGPKNVLEDAERSQRQLQRAR